jgi:hypothetical protein
MCAANITWMSFRDIATSASSSTSSRRLPTSNLRDRDRMLVQWRRQTTVGTLGQFQLVNEGNRQGAMQAIAPPIEGRGAVELALDGGVDELGAVSIR